MLHRKDYAIEHSQKEDFSTILMTIISAMFVRKIKRQIISLTQFSCPGLELKQTRTHIIL